MVGLAAWGRMFAEAMHSVKTGEPSFKRSMGVEFFDYLTTHPGDGEILNEAMTRGGAAGENAHMESFFHSLKADVIHGRVFHSVAELRDQLRRYLQHYNYRRLHSALGYQSPVDCERRAA